VDNGIKIWHYRGVLVYDLPVKEMYLAAWRPAEASAEPAELSAAPVGLAVQPLAKVGVYRPPGARANTSFVMVSDDRFNVVESRRAR
jgi:translation initiation factor 2A